MRKAYRKRCHEHISFLKSISGKVNGLRTGSVSEYLLILKSILCGWKGDILITSDFSAERDVKVSNSKHTNVSSGFVCALCFHHWGI